MIIDAGNDPRTGFDYVDQRLPDGSVERRWLTALPTPADHAMMALPTWQEATGIEPIARAEWPSLVFERRHTEVPILDQNGHGACVGYASTGIAMLLRAAAKMTFVLLSADSLYTLINHGRDMGAYGGDAIQAMQETGIAPAELVSGRPILKRQVSDTAWAEAPRFRLRPDSAIPLKSFDEVVTAVYMGWKILFDVQAGGRYNTGPDGTIAYLGRMTNHEQMGGEGLRMVNGKMQFLVRNSWNTVWGQDGFGWGTEQHIAGSNSTWALRWMLPDPKDPNNVPAFEGQAPSGDPFDQREIIA